MLRKRQWLAAAVGALAIASSPLLAEEGVRLPDGTRLEIVDFERHVHGLLTRLGCNAAKCHGANEGQGGFKLSLFGQSSEQDFQALTAAGSQRVIPGDAAASLALRKPTLEVEHEGGRRLQRDSWEFELLQRWITQGAPYRAGSGRPEQLRFEPNRSVVARPGDEQTLPVVAEFADGTREVVTAFATLSPRDPSVVEISPLGTIVARGSGATHVVAAYGHRFATLEILVPFPEPAAPSGTRLPTWNFIDEEINAKLTQLKLSVSPPADDAEFLRRASLDVVGALPTPGEVRQYQADADPAKRQKLVARLLADPRRAGWWATRMCEITACNVYQMEEPAELQSKRAKMWHDWFRVRLAENLPYDQLVQGVLCATSRQGQPVEQWIAWAGELERRASESFDVDYARQPGLDLFWRRVGAEGQVPVEDLAELTASAFMGLRLHCARCHQHPFDSWSQRDFAAYAMIFGRVRFGSGSDLRSAMNNLLEARRQARRSGTATTLPPLPRLQEVFIDDRSRPLVDAAPAGKVAACPPGGPALTSAVSDQSDHDPRRELYVWLTSADNPYFARNLVNRVWARYFGRGLVEPVDAFSESNPPLNGRLLDRLASYFVASGYDIMELERLILSSAAYGRSWRAAGNNAADKQWLARWPIRPLAAEVLVDAVDDVLETRTAFGADAPPGIRAAELATNRLADKQLEELLVMLGRGDRKSLCDCDRAPRLTLRQPLYLQTRNDMLADEGRLARLLRAGQSPAAIVEEFYLAALSRVPTSNELTTALKHVAAMPDARAGLADVVWSLVNSRQFSTNH